MGILDAPAVPLVEKGAPLGVATLDSGGKIVVTQLPNLAINDVFVVSSQAAMLALNAQRGDAAVRTDLTPNQTFLLSADIPTVLAAWKQVTLANVASVAGKTGAVVLVPTDVGAVEAGVAGNRLTVDVSPPSAPRIGDVWTDLDDLPGVLVPAASLLNVKDFGAKGDGVTDDSTAIQAAFDTASAQGKDVGFPPGTYKCLTGLRWDPVMHSVRGYGAVQLDFSAMATGYAITVTGQGSRSNSLGFNQSLHEMAGLKILGPDTDATTVDCFYLNDTANGSHVNFDRLFVFGFRDQWYLDTNLWCVRWSRSIFGHAHRRIFAIYAVANSGENFQLHGCTLYSSTNAAGTATAIYTDAAGNADTHLVMCSLDYNNVEIDHNSGSLDLVSCHLEDRSTGPMVKLSSSAGLAHTSLSILGGSVAPTEVAPGRDHLIEAKPGSTGNVAVAALGVAFATYDHACAIFKDLSGAGMRVSLRGTTVDQGGVTAHAVLGQPLNMLSNGDFEATSSFASPGWQHTGTLTFTIDTTNPRSGTRSAHIVGTGIAVSSTLNQMFPVTPGDALSFSMWINASGLTAGSVQMRYAWYIDRTSSRVLVVNVGVPITGGAGWQFVTAQAVVPQGITMAVIDAEHVNMAGDVWIDDVLVTRT